MGACASASSSVEAAASQACPTRGALSSAGDGKTQTGQQHQQQAWPGFSRKDRIACHKESGMLDELLISVGHGVSAMLPESDGVFQSLKGRNMAVMLGGPNSDKGVLVHKLQRRLGPRVCIICAETLLLQRLSKQVPGASIRGAIELAEKEGSTLTMQLLLELVAEQLQETPPPPSALVLIDLIPNLRAFSRAALLRNASKQLAMFERQTQAFRFALHVESGTLAPKSKRASTLPDEGDALQLQKRSQMHQSNSFPLIKFFEDNERLVSVRHVDNVVARVDHLCTWLQAYLDASTVPDVVRPSAAARAQPAVAACTMEQGDTTHHSVIIGLCCGASEVKRLERTLKSLCSSSGDVHVRAAIHPNSADALQHATALTHEAALTSSDTPVAANVLPVDASNISVQGIVNGRPRLVYCKAKSIAIGQSCVVDPQEAQLHAHDAGRMLVLVSRALWEREVVLLSTIT